MATEAEKPTGRVIDRAKALASMDRAKMRATRQADIRLHAAEDGSERAVPLSEFVKRRPGQRGPGKLPAKVQLPVRVEPELLLALKSSGKGWQDRVRTTLRKSVGLHPATEAPKAKQRA